MLWLTKKAPESCSDFFRKENLFSKRFLNNIFLLLVMRCFKARGWRGAGFATNKLHIFLMQPHKNKASSTHIFRLLLHPEALRIFIFFEYFFNLILWPRI